MTTFWFRLIYQHVRTDGRVVEVSIPVREAADTVAEAHAQLVHQTRNEKRFLRIEPAVEDAFLIYSTDK